MKMKRKLKKLLMLVSCVAMLTFNTVAVFCANLPAATSGPVTEGSSDSDSGAAASGDLVEAGVKALNTAEKKLVDVAMALFPVSLIILLVLLMATKNEKKVGALLIAAGTVCVATFVICLVNSGYVLTFIKSILGWGDIPVK